LNASCAAKSGIPVRALATLQKSTSNQVRLPAELKHINEAEEKKLTRIPIVMANEVGVAQVLNLAAALPEL